MPSASLSLLLSAVLGMSHALPWTGPRATNIYKAAAWSPAPTFVPVNPAELFKRSSVDVNVCGWIGGNSASSVTCSSGSSCIRDTIHGYVGCCTTSGACTVGVYSSCVDKNSAGWIPNSGVQSNGIYTCAGTSVCYRNTYAGGFYQYGCGAYGDGAEVATTYSGQASDVRLQIVYTGVTFSATTEVKSTSTASPSTFSTTGTSSLSPASSSIVNTAESPASVSSTIPTEGKESSNTTAETTTTKKKVSTGVIAGSAVAGVAVLAGLIGALLFCRHRKNNNNYNNNNNNNNNKPMRTVSFITQHQIRQPPISGPFQRIAPFSPDDIVSPLTAHPVNGPPPEQDITGAYSYGGPEILQPTNALDRWESQYNLPPPTENVPLFSEIDDFARGYYNAIDGYDQDIHTAADTDIDLGLGPTVRISSPLRRVGSGRSNLRAHSRDLTAEAFQLPNQSHQIQDEGWTPQGLRGASGEIHIRGGSGGSSSGESDRRSSNSASRGSGSGNSHVGSCDGDASPEIEIPLRSPLRQSRIWSGNAGLGNMTTVTVATSPVDDKKKRYQLVDDVVARDDVPILHSPGQLRHSRLGRRGN